MTSPKPRPRAPRIGGVIAAVLLLAACGDNDRPPVTDDASPAIDAAPTIDAGVDASPGALAPCLERPTDLLRPPSGQLPCELIPPDLAP